MTKSKVIVITGIIAFVGLILAVAIPNYIKSRETRSFPPCKANLLIIEDAKQRWAMKNSKTAEDMPTWADILPFFPPRLSTNILTCPEGGIYTLGRMRQSPACSLGYKSREHRTRP